MRAHSFHRSWGARTNSRPVITSRHLTQPSPAQPSHLQDVAAPDEQPPARAGTGAHQHSRRSSQAQGAGAGDDEHVAGHLWQTGRGQQCVRGDSGKASSLAE